MSEEDRRTLDAHRLLDVLDGVGLLLYVQDLDGRIVHVNRAACALVGREPEDVLGTVAHFGGDELVVLSEHVAGGAGGAGIAERILAELRAPIELEGERVVLSASIGVCIAPAEGPVSRDDLLRAADAAMYRAKADGPGRYVIAE